MTDSPSSPVRGYRQQIANSLTAVRPLPRPSRRVWAVVPAGLLIAATAPLLTGVRGDLDPYGPLVTWGATGLQALLGLWLLALGFREAVPGRNVSWRILLLAVTLTTALLAVITFITNEVSPTVVRAGREWEYWIECVTPSMALGTPFVILATLMTARAFPTRPAVTGALCGLSAGTLADSGWRLSCWISSPSHIGGAHGFAIVALTLAGAVLALVLDRRRWTELRDRVGRSS